MSDRFIEKPQEEKEQRQRPREGSRKFLCFQFEMLLKIVKIFRTTKRNPQKHQVRAVAAVLMEVAAVAKIKIKKRTKSTHQK